MATALAAVLLLPQIRKLARNAHADGVSGTWPAIGLVTNAAWTAYLVQAGRILAAPSTAMMVVSYGVVLALLSRLGRSLRLPLVQAGAWGAVLVLIGLRYGWLTLGLALGLSYSMQVAPALWTAYRTHAPRGVSPFTWTIVGIEGVLWGYYGWDKGDRPLVVFGAIAAITAAAMVLRYLSTRSRWVEAIA